VFEPFTAQTPSGAEARTERVCIAWYSTAGRFSEERTALREGVKTKYTAPGAKPFDPVPERRTGTIWLVVRDNRGGQAFDRYPFFVCDPSLPNPSVTGIAPPATPDGQVVVTGENLSATLDVVVGDVALNRGSFNASAGTFVGDAPALAAGSYAVKVRGRNCNDADTGLRYVVP